MSSPLVVHGMGGRPTMFCYLLLSPLLSSVVYHCTPPSRFFYRNGGGRVPSRPRGECVRRSQSGAAAFVAHQITLLDFFCYVAFGLVHPPPLSTYSPPNVEFFPNSTFAISSASRQPQHRFLARHLRLLADFPHARQFASPGYTL